MKRLLLVLFLITGTVYAKDREPDFTTATTSGTVRAKATSVTFIFSSDFTGTVGGMTFAGATDSSITISAPPADQLTAISYTVTAGNIRIIRVQ